MKQVLSYAAFTAVALVAGCVSTTEIANGTTGASASSSGSGGGGTGGGTTSSSSSSGSGGGTVCGGLHGTLCPDHEFCHFTPANCGGADEQGVCWPIPLDCSGPQPNPVCGCDGKVYTNECLANLAGVDASADKSCLSTCSAKSAAINTQVAGRPCTTVVRLTSKLEWSGYDIFCDGASVDEATALATANTMFAASTLVSGTPVDPGRDYVFAAFLQANNVHSAVSERTGKLLFGGMDNTGDMFPNWKDSADLGPTCMPTSNPPALLARGLEAGPDTPLADADMTPVLNTIWQSALLDGLWQSGYVFGAYVLKFPIGDFAPDYEWVVMIDSGMIPKK
jgi:hypothetical protein